MEKLIKVVDKEKGIVQITTVSERWYARESIDLTTGLPTYLYVPSTTWICSFWPKGLEYYRWVGARGWDKAEEIKNAAGDKGSKVHMALEAIFDGNEVKIDDYLPNPNTGLLESITLEEWECIMSGVAWANVRQPKSIKGEFVVFNEKDGYAGTVDRLFEIDGEIWIVDFKTSKNIWPEHKLQISSYKHALMETDPKAKDYKIMALQLGYKLNKTGYKETIVPDKYDKFLAVRQIWAEENPNEKPKQKDYPLTLKYEKVDQTTINQK